MTSSRSQLFKSSCAGILLAIGSFLLALSVTPVRAESPIIESEAVESETVESEAIESETIDAEQTESGENLTQSAPTELTTLIKKMDEAANAQRLKAFTGHFSKSFSHSDGFNRRQLKQTVRSFWDQYDQLSYSTELESWKEIRPGVYETVTSTTISGKTAADGPKTKSLTATVKSKQEIQDSKILSQTVLDEQSQIISGSTPPKVRVNLPTTVKVGEEYYFDVIIDEPLGDRILLGAAIEEAVTAKGYVNPSDFEIQSLATGGLFKIGQAPKEPTDQWISALLIQEGGMYMMSQRVSVVPSLETASNAPE